MPGGARGDTLPHTFCKNYVHVIFSTKDRRKTITKELQPPLWAYLAGIAKNHDMTIVALGGTEDHVHILFHLPPKLALAPPLRGFPDVPSAPTASALGYHVSSLTGLCFENPLLALGMQFSLQFIRIRSTPPLFSTGPRVIHIVP